MSIPSNQARGQAFSALLTNFYEFPSSDRAEPEVWCYTDQLSYAAGETVAFHVSTSADLYVIEISRDGKQTETVYRSADLPGEWQATPHDASVNGCGWRATHQWRIPESATSGGYIVTTRIRGSNDEEIRHHHFFVIRPSSRNREDRLLLICSTSTWIAYNGWGGSSHYEGNVKGADVNEMSPILSTQRPWARGQIVLPKGAPRVTLPTTAEMRDVPRYPPLEWAYMHGYAKYYSAAGWASYERHFVAWAESQGYAVDVITQHDLHYRPELLSGYRCVVVVGHDEYWSSSMRDAIDAHVESGGGVARFGGNFVWQVRLENEGRQQVCYKYFAHERDPLFKREPRYATSAWEDPALARPGATTFGLNALRGVYAGWGGMSPRHAKGFTVYRPEHWAFAGTGLYYGDTFGSQAQIFGFEVDGVDFTFRNGRPFPTHADGAPDSLQILAMGPSANIEIDHGDLHTGLMIGDLDARFTAQLLKGSADEATLESCTYGAGMIGIFARGAGTVFNAGSCEWVNGLRLREPICERVTANVIDRFLKA
jgi:hypothetical protein